MTSRRRVETALAHREADRVPLDLGGGPVTGMHVSSVYKLRQALELDPPGTPVRVVEPFQMLGEIAEDLMDALGSDVVGLSTADQLLRFPEPELEGVDRVRRRPAARAGGLSDAP